MKERKDRVDDALHATRAAVEEGILPGGGVALLRAVKALNRVKVDNEHQKHGVDIVKKAITWPACQIAVNAGEDGSVVLENGIYAFGFDAQTGNTPISCQGDHRPTKVVRSALQDAASVAGLMITTEAMIAEVPKKKPVQTPGAGLATWTRGWLPEEGPG